MTRADHRRDRESGFTLVELIVVVLIIAVLVGILVMALRGARVASRTAAMKSAAGTIDQGLADFVRIYPPVGGQADQLLTRGPAGAWVDNYGGVSEGLKDETDAQLVKSWPSNPYGNGGVRLFRTGPMSPCTLAGARPGDIVVCRLPASADRASGYTVVAWAADRSGAPVVVYDVTHG